MNIGTTRKSDVPSRTMHVAVRQTSSTALQNYSTEDWNLHVRILGRAFTNTKSSRLRRRGLNDDNQKKKRFTYRYIVLKRRDSLKGRCRERSGGGKEVQETNHKTEASDTRLCGMAKLKLRNGGPRHAHPAPRAQGISDELIAMENPINKLLEIIENIAHHVHT